MAQTYTLEEAADKLNLSVEDLKRRLRTEWTQVRPFRDGSTLRFRTNDIDEIARSLGLGSSDELPLGEGSAVHFPSDIGLAGGDDSGADFAAVDSSKPAKVKSGSDSDVRLEKVSGKPKKKTTDTEEDSILSEDLALPEAGGSGKLSGKSGKLSSARLKKGDAAKPATAEPDSSEFELSLDDPSSSEFELSLTQDSSEEVAIGKAPPTGQANAAGKSGINLNKPADSGVSLEKKGSDDEIDFELSLDTPGTGSSKKQAGKAQADSDSEFELTLEEPSDMGLDTTGAASGDDKKGDIFEATDFEIPALEDDSASEAVALDEADTDLESSDFDLALDEADVAADDDDSASQVVALDDEDEGRSKKKSRKKALIAADDDEDEDDDDVRDEADEDEDEDVVRPAAEQPKWGLFPVLFMTPTVLFVILGGLMAYELLHSVWGYQQSTQASTPLVSFFADTAGMAPAK